MRRLCVLIAVILFIVAVLGPVILGFGVRAAPPPKADERHALMQKKLVYSQKLLEGIALADFDKIGDNAKELLALSKQVQFMVLKTPAYELHANEFRRALEDIQKGVSKKNIDAATLGYMDMTMSCVRCHKHVREVRIARLDCDGARRPRRQPGTMPCTAGRGGHAARRDPHPAVRTPSLHGRPDTDRQLPVRFEPLPQPNASRHAGDHRQQRDVHLHLLLADRRRRAVRPGQHRLLHRRHRRAVDRPGRPVVHPGRHALQLRRPLGLHRKLLAVRPRRRLPRRQGGDGRLPGQALRLGPDVRLHPDRARSAASRPGSTSSAWSWTLLSTSVAASAVDRRLAADDVQGAGAPSSSPAPSRCISSARTCIGIHESSDKALKIMIATTIMARRSCSSGAASRWPSRAGTKPLPTRRRTCNEVRARRRRPDVRRRTTRINDVTGEQEDPLGFLDAHLRRRPAARTAGQPPRLARA